MSVPVIVSGTYMSTLLGRIKGSGGSYRLHTAYGLSLPLQTRVKMWQRFHLFFKACTKGYVVNSCLAPPLNPDIVKQ